MNCDTNLAHLCTIKNNFTNIGINSLILVIADTLNCIKCKHKSLKPVLSFT